MRASEFIREAQGKSSDQDTIDLVKLAWDEGKPRKAIADDLGLKDKQVAYILAKYHQSRPQRLLNLASALTDDDKNHIVTMFLNDEQVAIISKKYGIANHTVKNLLKHMLGVDRYNTIMSQRRATSGEQLRNKITPDMLVKLRELYAAGKPVTHISDYFDNVISSQAIHTAIRRQPDYAELRAKRDENTRKVKHSPVATTAIYRPGTIDNQRSKGPQSRHTSGVNWPKYG
jgi:hypothetical protein